MKMESSLQKQLFKIGDKLFNSPQNRRSWTELFRVTDSLFANSTNVFHNPISFPTLSFITTRKSKNHLRVCATRRRRVHSNSDTYVLLEAGQDEQFVSEDELKAKLKGWFKNCPEKSLPPDLARFDDLNEAVEF